MTALNILERWGFCPFCLAIKDSRSIVTVVTLNDEGIKEHERIPDGIMTSPLHLIEWLETQLSEKDVVEFQLNMISRAFIPVAVINGAPVCPCHLWHETN